MPKPLKIPFKVTLQSFLTLLFFCNHIWAPLSFFALAIPAGSVRGDDGTNGKAELVDNRIVFHQKDGTTKVIVDDDVERENLATSPEGTLAAINEKYHPYSRPEPGPDFSIIFVDLHRGEVQCRASVQGVGRWLQSIEWLGERWLLVRGEYYRFVDSVTCSVTDLIWGTQYQIASDRKKMAFVYGAVPKYFSETPSFDVGLASVAIRSKEEMWAWFRVYPAFSTSPYSTEEWRKTGIKHLFLGNFGWDAASRRLAFVEEIQNKFWLVCLDIEPCNREEPPALLLREPFNISRAFQAHVTWDGDVVTVEDRPDLEGEDRKPQAWTFRCPPVGSPAATTETGPAEPPSATTQTSESHRSPQ